MLPLPCLEGATKFSNFSRKALYLWPILVVPFKREHRQNAFLLDSAKWVKAFARITLVFHKKNTFFGVEKVGDYVSRHMKLSHYFKHHILLTPRQRT